MAVVSIDECKERILRPVNESAIGEGMRIEKKHKLHITGKQSLLREFLTMNKKVETADDYDLRIRSTRAVTKTIYAPIVNYITKGLDMGGMTTHYHFKNDDDEILSQDYQAYLDSTDWDGMNFYKSIHSKLKKVHFTDSQGVIYVDIPKRSDGQFAEPYYDFFPSNQIHDIDITGHKVEFIIFCQEVIVKKEGVKQDKYERFFCVDDSEIRVMRLNNQGDAVFDENYQIVDENGFPQQRWQVTNTLGYVPAFPCSHEIVESTNDITRTSLIGQSLELADLMLNDHSEHEFNKRLHAFQEKYVFAKECNTCHGEKTHIYDADIGPVTCRECNGEGSVYPTGASKVFMLKPPQYKDDPAPGIPAGYIIKDLAPTELLGREMEKWGKAIGVSVFSQDLQANISPETATAKEIDDDDKQTLVRRFIEFMEMTVKNVIDTMGLLRYSVLYENSTVRYNRNPQMRRATDLEKEYDYLKKAGFNDTILFEKLEDINDAKFRNDPIKRHRELLLLHLIPFPTKTDEEVERLPVSEEDKRFRAYFTDYIRRFEREESRIEKFGAALRFPDQLAAILLILRRYNAPEQNDIEGDDNLDDPRNIAQAEAQANLRGSVGGVQGLLEVQKAVGEGTTSYDAGLEILKEIYGFDEVKARKILGKTINQNNTTNGKANQNIQASPAGNNDQTKAA